MITDVTITPLFPTSVLSGNIGRDFTVKELETIKSLKLDCSNDKAYQTNNTHILDEDTFKKLRGEVEDMLNRYVDEIINPSQDIKLTLTQSFANRYLPEGKLHIHNHPNSYLSGVVMIESHPDDVISFIDESYRQILPTQTQFNLLNSSHWEFPAITGNIYVFPSKLLHKVPETVSGQERWSLAFNSFPLAVIGDASWKTELDLTREKG